MPLVEPNDFICFIGDSVTDCGRSREDPSDLGPSYVKKIQAYLSEFYAGWNVRVANRGISGNRVRDLRQRWQTDCLDDQPDVVNILIGINDTWRRYDSNDPETPEAFEADYRDILTRASAAGARISIMEPFLMPHPPEKQEWRVDFDPKIQVVRAMAREFHAVYIPLDGIFARLSAQEDSHTFSADGVHPVDAGHSVIARAWLEAAGLLRV